MSATDTTHGAPPLPITAEERAELLAIADPVSLHELADACIALHGDPVVLVAPETGLVMLQVREPVCEERFHLGEIVVTRAEVALAGGHGWAMRIGVDRLTALAAAICDAIVEAPLSEGDPGRHLADAVTELCRRTAVAAEAAAQSEWRELRRTEVDFEELD